MCVCVLNSSPPFFWIKLANVFKCTICFSDKLAKITQIYTNSGGFCLTWNEGSRKFSSVLLIFLQRYRSQQKTWLTLTRQINYLKQAWNSKNYMIKCSIWPLELTVMLYFRIKCKPSFFSILQNWARFRIMTS